MKINKQKKIPLRTCIVTHQKLPKKELVRFVLNSETKEIALDTNGKLRGRGANMTPTMEIFEKALKTGAFNRSFKMNIKKENFELLRKQLEEYLEAKANAIREKKVVRVSKGKVKL